MTPSLLGSPQSRPTGARDAGVSCPSSRDQMQLICSIRLPKPQLSQGADQILSMYLSQCAASHLVTCDHTDRQYKPADMANRISQSYHPSLVNIPVIPSPHGSPRVRPTSIRMSSHPSLVNIPIMPSPVPSPRSRPNSIHVSSRVSPVLHDISQELTTSVTSIHHWRSRPIIPLSIFRSSPRRLLPLPRSLLSPL